MLQRVDQSPKQRLLRIEASVHTALGAYHNHPVSDSPRVPADRPLPDEASTLDPIRAIEVVPPESSDIETRSRRIAQLEDLLRHTQAALLRLEQGVFGKCTHCGHEIAADRLQVVPYAPTCAACAAQPNEP